MVDSVGADRSATGGVAAGDDARKTDQWSRSSSRRLVGRMERLCLKELREILRDRRTLITLFMMPLLVYPLLSMVFHRSLLSTSSADGLTRLVIGADTEEGLAMVATLMSADPRATAAPSDDDADDGQSAKTGNRTAARGTDHERNATVAGDIAEADNEGVEDAVAVGSGGVGAPAVESPSIQQLPVNPLELSQQTPPFDWQYVQDLPGGVAKGALDLGIKVRRRALADDGAAGPQPVGRAYDFELIHRRGSVLSDQALRLVDERLGALNEGLLLRRLAMFGHTTESPVKSRRVEVGDAAGPVNFSSLIPLVLILMTVTGAVYPAIDLTAGERERGTMEMLMASPVPRLALLLAKYVAVVVVATLTATVNLCAMMLTLTATGLTSVVFGPQGVTLELIGQFFALLILFASFFSAVLLAVTSNARSFKEAQAYLIPLMLLSLGPGVMSLMPGLQFNRLLAIMPVANMVMLARDLTAGQVDPILAVVSVISTIIYTVTAIAIAARIFGMDAVLHGGQASWSDFMRGSHGPRSVPSVSGALFCLAILFPSYFLISSSLGRLHLQSWNVRLFLGSLATILLFAGIPWLAARLQRLPLRASFQLDRPRVTGLIAGAVLGVSLWPMAYEVFWLSELLGLQTINPKLLDAVESMLRGYADLPLPVVWVAMGIVPAVCEEFFFRGFLFSALRAATTKWKTIAISSLLFGAFHVVSSSALSPERFLPSSFLGVVLGMVCWRTRSLFPGIVLHALHNSLLFTLAHYRETLSSTRWGLAQQTHLPWTWHALAIVGVTIGAVLLWRQPATTPSLGRDLEAPVSTPL